MILTGETVLVLHLSCLMQSLNDVTPNCLFPVFVILLCLRVSILAVNAFGIDVCGKNLTKQKAAFWIGNLFCWHNSNQTFSEAEVNDFTFCQRKKTTQWNLNSECPWRPFLFFSSQSSDRHLMLFGWIYSFHRATLTKRTRNHTKGANLRSAAGWISSKHFHFSWNVSHTKESENAQPHWHPKLSNSWKKLNLKKIPNHKRHSQKKSILQIPSCNMPSGKSIRIWTLLSGWNFFFALCSFLDAPSATFSASHSKTDWAANFFPVSANKLKIWRRSLMPQ